jgi:hypothetical protein
VVPELLLLARPWAEILSPFTGLSREAAASCRCTCRKTSNLQSRYAAVHVAGLPAILRGYFTIKDPFGVRSAGR